MVTYRRGREPQITIGGDLSAPLTAGLKRSRTREGQKAIPDAARHKDAVICAAWLRPKTKSLGALGRRKTRTATSGVRHALIALRRTRSSIAGGVTQTGRLAQLAHLRLQRGAAAARSLARAITKGRTLRAQQTPGASTDSSRTPALSRRPDYLPRTQRKRSMRHALHAS